MLYGRAREVFPSPRLKDIYVQGRPYEWSLGRSALITIGSRQPCDFLVLPGMHSSRALVAVPRCCQNSSRR